MRPLGRFNLDPCSPNIRPWDTADHHWSLPIDGLLHPWFNRVWLNPPFNRYERPKWMQKMAEHGDGIMLIPAATETAAFDSFVWQKATAVCFLKGRPHFCVARDTILERKNQPHIFIKKGEEAPFNCGCSIVLVAYGDQNAEVLSNSGLGKTLFLGN